MFSANLLRIRISNNTKKTTTLTNSKWVNGRHIMYTENYENNFYFDGLTVYGA